MAIDKTYGLTDETRLKNRLGIDSTDATRDAVFKSMIYAVTDFIEGMCGRRFKRATYSNEVYDGNEAGEQTVLNWLTLRNGPVVSISSVQYATGDMSSPTWVDFPASSYQADLRLGQLYFRGGIPRGMQNIRVSYVGGYLIDFANAYDSALHTLPFEVQDLAERLTTKLIKRRESEGKSQEAFNNSSIVWGSFLEDQDRQIIANYRRVSV